MPRRQGLGRGSDARMDVEDREDCLNIQRMQTMDEPAALFCNEREMHEATSFEKKNCPRWAVATRLHGPRMPAGLHRQTSSAKINKQPHASNRARRRLIFGSRRPGNNICPAVRILLADFEETTMLDWMILRRVNCCCRVECCA
jgi:hypothetical protein